MALPALIIGALLLVSSLVAQSRKSPNEAPSPIPPAQEMALSPFVGCSQCHGNLDENLPSTDLKFTHQFHFSKGVSDCASCHPANTHQQDKINLPTMTMCYQCHGTSKNSLAPGSCATCHPTSMAQIPKSHFVSNWLPTAHSVAAMSDVATCQTCHEQTFCNSCHGLPMPHPAGWKGEPHVVTYFQDPAACTNCHAVSATSYSFCDTCHHPQDPKGTSWVQYHPKVVTQDAAFTCFRCHNPTTCSTCHTTGKFSLSADQNYTPPATVPGSPAPSYAPVGG
jgi:hypothetical protein